MDEKFMHGNALVFNDKKRLYHIPKDENNKYSECGKQITALARGLIDATCPTCRRIRHALNTWDTSEDYVYTIGDLRLVVYATSKAEEQGFFRFEIKARDEFGYWWGEEYSHGYSDYETMIRRGFISLEYWINRPTHKDQRE